MQAPDRETIADLLERLETEPALAFQIVARIAESDHVVEPPLAAALLRAAARLDDASADVRRAALESWSSLPRPSSAFALAADLGLLRRLLPELDACVAVPQNPHHAYDVFHHSLAAADRAVGESAVVRLAALLHDAGKPETRVQHEETASFHNHQMTGARLASDLLERLGFAVETRDRVTRLVRHHMFHYTEEWTDGAVRRFVREVGPDLVEELFRTRAADTLGNGLRKQVAKELAILRGRIAELAERDAAFSVRDLAIDGRTLMAELSLSPGPEVGALLHRLTAAVAAGQLENDRGALLEVARKFRDT